jgi:hypothetical protein
MSQFTLYLFYHLDLAAWLEGGAEVTGRRMGNGGSRIWILVKSGTCSLKLNDP